MPSAYWRGEAKKRRRASDGRAFTLIELLVLVAVIAILAAIAVPNFLNIQIRAKTAATADDLHTLAAALQAYWLEHRAYPPNLIQMEMVRLPDAPGADLRTFRARRRIEIGPGQWLCETSQSISQRTIPPVSAAAQPPTVLSDQLSGGPVQPPADCPLSYNGIGLIRLTTPIPYVGVLPIDRYFSRGGHWAGARFRPPAIWGPSDPTAPPLDLWDMRPHGYYHFAEIAPEGVAIAAFGRTVPFVLVSFGPDVRPSFTDPTVPFPAFYDPTNGAVSAGDLIVIGNE